MPLRNGTPARFEVALPLSGPLPPPLHLRKLVGEHHLGLCTRCPFQRKIWVDFRVRTQPESLQYECEGNPERNVRNSETSRRYPSSNGSFTHVGRSNNVRAIWSISYRKLVHSKRIPKMTCATPHGELRSTIFRSLVGRSKTSQTIFLGPSASGQA